MHKILVEVGKSEQSENWDAEDEEDNTGKKGNFRI